MYRPSQDLLGDGFLVVFIARGASQSQAYFCGMHHLLAVSLSWLGIFQIFFYYCSYFVLRCWYGWAFSDYLMWWVFQGKQKCFRQISPAVPCRFCVGCANCSETTPQKFDICAKKFVLANVAIEKCVSTGNVCTVMLGQQNIQTAMKTHHFKSLFLPLEISRFQGLLPQDQTQKTHKIRKVISHHQDKHPQTIMVNVPKFALTNNEREIWVCNFHSMALFEHWTNTLLRGGGANLFIPFPFP